TSRKQCAYVHDRWPRYNTSDAAGLTRSNYRRKLNELRQMTVTQLFQDSEYKTFSTLERKNNII
ncbi:hypothetical protein CRM22_002349, partial [Opisthorchis felineus]